MWGAGFTTHTCEECLLVPKRGPSQRNFRGFIILPILLGKNVFSAKIHIQISMNFHGKSMAKNGKKILKMMGDL